MIVCMLCTKITSAGRHCTILHLLNDTKQTKWQIKGVNAQLSLNVNKRALPYGTVNSESRLSNRKFQLWAFMMTYPARNNGTHHWPLVHHAQAPPFSGLYGYYSQAMESSSSEHWVDHLAAVGQFYKLMFEQAHPAGQLSASKFSAKGGVCTSRTMITTCVLPIFAWKSVSNCVCVCVHACVCKHDKKKFVFKKFWGIAVSVVSTVWSLVLCGFLQTSSLSRVWCERSGGSRRWECPWDI